MPEATVLIPTHDHGRLLARSVASVQRQTLSDVEILIIGDGATEETRETAHALAGADERIRFFDREKSPRTGEPYRHEVLQDARGGFVSYLADDDLWLPHHLEGMRDLLGEADFANAFMLRVHADGRLEPFFCDLSEPLYVARHRDERRPKNYMPLSSVSHRLDAYRRLPHGWRTTPGGVPTDLHMWRQWLAADGMRFASASRASVLNFPDGERRQQALADRDAELLAWLDRIGTVEGRLEIAEQIVADLRARVLREKLRPARTFRSLFGLLGDRRR
ncbi:MAG: glycosyltransferase family 2 protein [Myxococcota bacterium]